MMGDDLYAMQIDGQRCKGCGRCIEGCPVNAIQLQSGKAQILRRRCVDCGDCIRMCPNQARAFNADTLATLSLYPYSIALLPPSLEVFLDTECFSDEISFEDLQDVFSNMGFSEVFRVAEAAEVVGFIIEQHVLRKLCARPLFSSSCPAVLKLIRMRFPGLLKHVAPVLSPMEVAARLAKERAAEKTGLSPEKIGAFFVSPCPAKAAEARDPIMTTRSAVDRVIGVNLVYRDIITGLSRKAVVNRRNEAEGTVATGTGTGCSAGDRPLTTSMTVSGIHNVIRLLGEMEGGRFVRTDFVELLACPGGCPEGPLNSRKPFASISDLGGLIQKYRVKQRFHDHEHLLDIYRRGCFASAAPILPAPAEVADPDQSVHAGVGT